MCVCLIATESRKKLTSAISIALVHAAGLAVDTYDTHTHTYHRALLTLSNGARDVDQFKHRLRTHRVDALIKLYNGVHCATVDVVAV